MKAEKFGTASCLPFLGNLCLGGPPASRQTILQPPGQCSALLLSWAGIVNRQVSIYQVPDWRSRPFPKETQKSVFLVQKCRLPPCCSHRVYPALNHICALRSALSLIAHTCVHTQHICTATCTSLQKPLWSQDLILTNPTWTLWSRRSRIKRVKSALLGEELQSLWQQLFVHSVVNIGWNLDWSYEAAFSPALIIHCVSMVTQWQSGWTTQEPSMWGAFQGLPTFMIIFSLKL